MPLSIDGFVPFKNSTAVNVFLSKVNIKEYNLMVSRPVQNIQHTTVLTYV